MSTKRNFKNDLTSTVIRMWVCIRERRKKSECFGGLESKEKNKTQENKSVRGEKMKQEQMWQKKWSMCRHECRCSPWVCYTLDPGSHQLSGLSPLTAWILIRFVAIETLCAHTAHIRISLWSHSMPSILNHFTCFTAGPWSTSRRNYLYSYIQDLCDCFVIVCPL